MQLGAADGVRHRLATWLGEGGDVVAVTSDGGERESLVVLRSDGTEPERRLEGLDLGRAIDLISPRGSKSAVLSNHRGELLLLDLSASEVQAKVLDSSEFGEIHGLAASHDGRWIAYEFATSPQTSAIKVCRLQTGEASFATRPVLIDRSPAFDPKGRYLYFIGERDFDPTYDSHHFDLGFPQGSRPYAVTLQAGLRSPFRPEPAPAGAPPAKAGEGEAPPLEIDLEGIEDRVRPFPVPQGRYARIAGAGNFALFSSNPVEGVARRPVLSGKPEPNGRLQVFDFATQRVETFADAVSDFQVGPDGETVLYSAGERLRVVKAGPKAPEAPAGVGDKPGRQSGWVDLDRVKVSVEPDREWRQMFREAWRLQRENFWNEALSGVDWDGAYARYEPLLERVATRSEFSDLVWELQGELGTSHAYEMGGDYRAGAEQRLGNLAADLGYDEDADAYRVLHIARGDAWNEDATSPLRAPGADVRVGDLILAVNGQRVDRQATPASRLVNLAGTEVVLTVRRDGEAPRSVAIRTASDDRQARYRDWVESNRAAVHAASADRIGYLHIPNMQALGFGEFHRGFLAEYDHDALIVDVRFNGGGHVSPLLIEKLARKRLGYSVPRRFSPRPYPPESPAGPLVAITNEQAGSDGDIFSHCFKLMRLGPLVGKRTWGGVVGISPRLLLADGSVTTQPEHAFFFDDVGWSVENYGTDPDHEVEMRPQDYGRGADPQLERAIELALAALETAPPHRPQGAADQAPIADVSRNAS